MATDSSNELSAFVQFLTNRLDAGRTDLSPEEALDNWREQHPAEQDYAESVAAIRAALADMDAGDTGIPLEQFDRELRERHNFPPAS